MKKSPYLILLILIVMMTHLSAQDNENCKLMELYEISYIEASILKTDSDLDSFIMTKEYFNSKGYRTKIEIFYSERPGCIYEYIYAADTLKTQRLTYCGGKLISITKLFYNDRNQLISAIDFDKEGKATDTYQVIEYDKHHRIKLNYLTINGRRISRERIYYRKNGNIKFRSIRYQNKPTKKIRYNKDGTPLKSIDRDLITVNNYKNTDLTYQSETKIISQNIKMIAVGGDTSFVKGDKVTTERYIDHRGLIIEETQQINDGKKVIKRYKYISNPRIK